MKKPYVPNNADNYLRRAERIERNRNEERILSITVVVLLLTALCIFLAVSSFALISVGGF
jgi:hypothetical protein